jgi:hypothetical protein
MLARKYLPEFLLVAIYLTGFTVSAISGEVKNITGDLFSVVVSSIIAVFIYKWQLKKREPFAAWIVAFFFPFIVLYYVIVKPFIFVLNIFSKATPTLGKVNENLDTLSVRIEQTNLSGKSDDVRRLTAELEDYEKKYNFQASLPESARDISLEVLEARMKDIRFNLKFKEDEVTRHQNYLDNK